jgi:uncharacterized paraquat-inducible protein A
MAREQYEGAVICAWCKKVLAEGDKSVPPSHGICPRCAQKMRAQLDKKMS